MKKLFRVWSDNSKLSHYPLSTEENSTEFITFRDELSPHTKSAVNRSETSKEWKRNHIISPWTYTQLKIWSSAEEKLPKVLPKSMILWCLIITNIYLLKTFISHLRIGHVQYAIIRLLQNFQFFTDQSQLGTFGDQQTIMAENQPWKKPDFETSKVNQYVSAMEHWEYNSFQC